MQSCLLRAKGCSLCIFLYFIPSGRTQHLQSRRLSILNAVMMTMNSPSHFDIFSRFSLVRYSYQVPIPASPWRIIYRLCNCAVVYLVVDVEPAASREKRRKPGERVVIVVVLHRTDIYVHLASRYQLPVAYVQDRYHFIDVNDLYIKGIWRNVGRKKFRIVGYKTIIAQTERALIQY